MKKLSDYASGNFLKAINVSSDKDAFVVTKVDELQEKEQDDVRDVLRLGLEHEGAEYDFDVNKTNAKFLTERGIGYTKELMGKKLFFKKALVRNPRTNQEVEGLRICAIE